LQIKTLQNAHRDADTLQLPLKAKKRKRSKGQQTKKRQTGRLVTKEIDMLQIVLYLAMGKEEEMSDRELFLRSSLYFSYPITF
jgi:hypothetical protein